MVAGSGACAEPVLRGEGEPAGGEATWGVATGAVDKTSLAYLSTGTGTRDRAAALSGGPKKRR
ncbi:hypothetical protein GCM10010340_61760 [Streptomyces griseoloalbus]|nr:hypothetical protein GCM10010294_65280 [Streptomyces griseoloalbus]GGW74955.1 hypothetical protein GCM10010340_61760 [Streptomyces albaduncus]